MFSNKVLLNDETLGEKWVKHLMKEISSSLYFGVDGQSVAHKNMYVEWRMDLTKCHHNLRSKYPIVSEETESVKKLVVLLR